jgi:CheY-like chemotaxis protein
VRELHTRLRAVGESKHTINFTRLMGDFQFSVKKLGIAAERAAQPTLTRLCAALEAALARAEKETHQTRSAILHAAEVTLEVLEELSEHPDSVPDISEAKARILIVDDDALARRAMTMCVQLAFGRPDHAASGEAAVALATASTYDIIFLDVRMPGLNGFATCHRIRETATNANTPVVFVTSLNDNAALESAAGSGGNAFLTKPAPSSLIKLLALTYLVRARSSRFGPPRKLEVIPDLVPV